MKRLRLAWRMFVDFLGWWMPATIALHYSVLGWFTPLFPQPWHTLLVSAALAFVAVVYFAWRETKQGCHCGY